MEICKGKNLRSFLSEKNSIPEDIIPYFKIKVFLDCVNAITYLRSKLIVNRDIKPENTMV